MQKHNLLGAYAFVNVLTGLIPDLFAGLNVVSREMVGFIPSVTRNVSAERAAKDQNITYPVAPSLSSQNIVPAMSSAEPPDVTVGYGQMTISKSKAVEFGFVGEEYVGLNNGAGYNQIQADLFAEALRVLVNEVEADIAQEAAVNACRAFGTAGTTPFASDLSDSAFVNQILDDNGAPMTGRSLVINSAAKARLQSLGQLTKVNEAGDRMTLRDGMLGDIHGAMIKASGQVKTLTKGTAASATTNTAGYAFGATVITLASAGTGTILAGDYITFAGDTNKYLVVSGDADVSGGGSITLAAPGLRIAIGTSATAITVVGTSARNILFPQSAIHLVTRAPALVGGRDAAIDSMMMTDPRSGISFDVRVYAGDHKLKFQVGLAWGQKAVKRQHIAALLG